MGRQAVEIDANTFQFFSRNPRGSRARSLDLEDISAYRTFAGEHGLTGLLAHAPYTVNPASDKAEVREFALKVLREDIERLEHLPGTMYNVHPGSHVRQGTKKGISYIVQALNEVLDRDQKTVVLLETMAGKGTEIGRSFEELADILCGVTCPDLLGICLDTCHIYDGGYDVCTDLDGVLSLFDKVLGLHKLRAVHLNDSLNVCGSHKDRHACIGKGEIGLAALTRVINHPALRHLPFYLETPNNLEGYACEIALLRENYREVDQGQDHAAGQNDPAKQDGLFMDGCAKEEYGSDYCCSEKG